MCHVLTSLYFRVNSTQSSHITESMQKCVIISDNGNKVELIVCQYICYSAGYDGLQ